MQKQVLLHSYAYGSILALIKGEIMFINRLLILLSLTLSLSASEKEKAKPIAPAEKNRLEHILEIATNPTVLILSGAALATAITQGPQYFSQRSFTYKDPLFLNFYFTILTEGQQKEHEDLLKKIPHPAVLLQNKHFLTSLVGYQKVSFLEIVRAYYKEKELLSQPFDAGIGFSFLPAFKDAQKEAVALFRAPYELFEKEVLNEFSLARIAQDILAQTSSLRKKLYDLFKTSIIELDASHCYCAGVIPKNVVLIWDLPLAKCVALIHIPVQHEVIALAFDETASICAALTSTREIFIISPIEQKIVTSFKHAEPILNLRTIAQAHSVKTNVAQLPAWIGQLQDLIMSARKRLPDSTTSYDSFFTSASPDPYVLIAQEDFKKVLEQMSKEEKVTLQTLLFSFSKEEHYQKPLKAGILITHLDKRTQRPLQEIFIESPENLAMQDYTEQLTEEEHACITSVMKQMQKDMELLGQFSAEHGLGTNF